MVCLWWMFVRVLFSCFDLDQIPQVEQCKGACEWECHMLSLWPFCILWALVNILTPCLMVVQQHEIFSCSKLLRDLGSLSYCSASSQGLMKPQCRMWTYTVHMVSPDGSNVQKRWGSTTLGFGIVCMVEVVLRVKIPFISQPSGVGRWETEWRAQAPSKYVT